MLKTNLKHLVSEKELNELVSNDTEMSSSLSIIRWLQTGQVNFILNYCERLPIS